MIDKIGQLMYPVTVAATYSTTGNPAAQKAGLVSRLEPITGHEHSIQTIVPQEAIRGVTVPSKVKTQPDNNT